MKTVIAALNSKYVHLSLAPWYLKSSCREICNIAVLELTINQSKAEIMRRIYKEKPDIIAFSCYIFNIAHIEAIVKDIKKVLPNLKIILGGPEVSYHAVEVLKSNPEADYVVCAEGEIRLKRLLQAIAAGKEPQIDGVAFRSDGAVKYAPPADFIKNLDELPSPYTDEMLAAAKGKIVYFESSRGCPFRCAYCLSPQTGGVRRFSFERVKADLSRLMNSDARQIKFVDRTFNCNAAHAKEIVCFIINETATNPKAAAKNYHFEAAADLFDDELIALLSGAPAGLFQLEIGIQSFNEKTLAASLRKTDLALCERNIQKVLQAGNMHLHLDLIAGLPYEDYASFIQSFNRIYSLSPHRIQLGFLKLLHGSELRRGADKYRFSFSALPPYEVFSTPWLSYDEMLLLKDIETVVDALYNSGRFVTSLRFIAARFDCAFDFFFEFSQYLKSFYPEGFGIPSRALYNLLLGFAKERLSGGDTSIFGELLKYDFFASDSSCNAPKSLERTEIPGVRALYDAESTARGRVHFERFTVDPQNPGLGKADKPVDYRFDYSVKNTVTGLYAAERI